MTSTTPRPHLRPGRQYSQSLLKTASVARIEIAVTCPYTSVFANPGGDATRTFTSFSQALDELVLVRIWAGPHFRTADLQGRQLGADVANFAAANYFQPVGNH
jgi:hypothetical protein